MQTAKLKQIFIDFIFYIEHNPSLWEQNRDYYENYFN